MTSLSNSRTIRVCLTAIYSSLATAGLLVSLGVCQDVAAQNIQPRPVARLISEPSAAAALSRPRRVKPEASAAAAVEPAASNIAGPNSIERRAFEQTNAVRVENGLQPVSWDAELCRMARAHSQRMAEENFFSHKSPEGMELKQRARANGIMHFRVIGENIAYNKGYNDPGGFAVERWMVSSGHRANILYVGFQSGAIGSYVAPDGSVYLTQIFIAR